MQSFEAHATLLLGNDEKYTLLYAWRLTRMYTTTNSFSKKSVCFGSFGDSSLPTTQNLATAGVSSRVMIHAILLLFFFLCVYFPNQPWLHRERLSCVFFDDRVLRLPAIASVRPRPPWSWWPRPQTRPGSTSTLKCWHCTRIHWHSHNEITHCNNSSQLTNKKKKKKQFNRKNKVHFTWRSARKMKNTVINTISWIMPKAQSFRLPLKMPKRDSVARVQKYNGGCCTEYEGWAEVQSRQNRGQSKLGKLLRRVRGIQTEKKKKRQPANQQVGNHPNYWRKIKLTS